MSATTEFKFSATTRTKTGSANARRLRRDQKIPATLYGFGKAPLNLELEHKAVMKLLSHDEVFSQVVSLEVDGQAEPVVIKALERHHTKPIINHMDFFRINANEEITMHIPIHFVGEQDSPGVKAGGVVSHALQDIEISCLPAKLPQSIEVDLANLEMDHALHLTDVILPEGVALATEITEEHNPTVVSIHMPRVEEESEESAAADDESADTASEQPSTADSEGEAPAKEG